MLKFGKKILLTLAAVVGFSSTTMLLGAEREQVVVSNLGPQIGDQVPDFQLSDQFGELQNHSNSSYQSIRHNHQPLHIHHIPQHNLKFHRSHLYYNYYSNMDLMDYQQQQTSL